MSQAHLTALKKKHEDIDKKIHTEATYAAKNEQMIKRLKEEKLHVKQEIEKLSKAE